jgi:hypothetical protein
MLNPASNKTTRQTDAELLSLAAFTEDLHAKWLGELIDRFYSFDREACFELEEIYFQTMENKQNIERLYHKLHGPQLQPVNFPVFGANFQNRFRNVEHFLVINNEMAYGELLKIRDAEFDSLFFYRQSSALAWDPILTRFFESCLPFKQKKRDILENLLNHYHAHIIKEERPLKSKGVLLSLINRRMMTLMEF